MKRLSELISKKVLNIYLGKLEGLVLDVIFDDKYEKITRLTLVDLDDEEYEVETRAIYSTKDIVTIRNSAKITPIISKTEKRTNNPILKDVYSITGEYLGRLTDIEIKDNFAVNSFITEVVTFTPKQIVNVKENIIVDTQNKKVKLSHFKPKHTMPRVIKNTDDEKRVTILAPQIEALETSPSTYTISSTPTPQRILGTNDFLLGRKADKTIYSLNNDLIIRKDNLITKKHLELARKYGKLAELTIFSKKA